MANIVLSPNAPASAGVLYDISQEYPNDPFFTWFRWINYPWQFSGGVGRIALPNDPVVPPIGG
jgi:hypothetical protein